MLPQDKAGNKSSTPATNERCDLLNVSAAAARLGVRRRTVMDWVRRGELAAVVYKRGRDGRATIVAFRPEAIAAFIRRHEKGTVPASSSSGQASEGRK